MLAKIRYGEKPEECFFVPVANIVEARWVKLEGRPHLDIDYKRPDIGNADAIHGVMLNEYYGREFLRLVNNPHGVNCGEGVSK